MAEDNVTPIGPHVTVPETASSEQLKAALDRIAERVQEQRTRIFQAMGVVSCVAAAAPDNYEEGEPDLKYALKAAEAILDDVCTALDPSRLEDEGATNG